MDEFSDKVIRQKEHLLVAKEEIRNVFREMHSQIQIREDELLEEIDRRIQELEFEFENNKDTLVKLFKAKEDTHVFLKDNEFSDVLPNTLQKLQCKLDTLEQLITHNAHIEIIWNISNFQASLNSICKILKFGTYNHKLVPKWGTVNKGREERDLSMPHGIAVDERDNSILVADTLLKCVKVFNTEGMFVKKLSQPAREYWDIVVWQEATFVSHNTGIIKFDTSTGLECGELDTNREIRGLAICDEGLFACVRREFKILVCDQHLNILNEIQLKTPFMTELTLTMAVKLRNYSLYVLFLYSQYSIQLFDMCGTFLRVLVSEKEAPFSRFFSLDSIGNVILTDNNLYKIKVFNNSGELVHVIGKMGWSPGEFLKISGIAVNSKNEIYVCDEGSPDRMLQCF
ncbi:hypothetical protein LOD99_2794 [Oopsacas minuta]|uniref:Uncharacterized protein n=1 Tax=Oopsacas minuta TaxID=111878 RepID=A0AAV7K1I9_9METZ|nr:hypothetical protein LOD99_2794 [Oopsacas minuta]